MRWPWRRAQAGPVSPGGQSGQQQGPGAAGGSDGARLGRYSGHTAWRGGGYVREGWRAGAEPKYIGMRGAYNPMGNVGFSGNSHKS